jgi:hypothetical protein
MSKIQQIKTAPSAIEKIVSGLIACPSHLAGDPRIAHQFRQPCKENNYESGDRLNDALEETSELNLSPISDCRNYGISPTPSRPATSRGGGIDPAAMSQTLCEGACRDKSGALVK